MIADLAEVGPAYLPGHAHADSLSYELSIGTERVIVNRGTSQYGTDARRQWERGTGAHNAVLVDGQDSSEVWAGFRVGRRAHIAPRSIEAGADTVRLHAGHTGYRRFRGRPTHIRDWVISESCVIISDTISGNERHQIASLLHLHPACSVTKSGSRSVQVHDADGAPLCAISFEGDAELNVEETLHADRFGSLEAATTLRFEAAERTLPLELRTTIDWTHAN